MKAYKETVRKYYKYSYSSWTRPNISSNGTLGGNSFACSGGVSNPWQCFDGNSGTMGQFYATSESYKTLIFYNPTPIKIYSVGFTYYPSAYIKQATFYGSNDNSTWTEITSFTNSANSNIVNFPNNVNAYKYYKLYITSANGHDGWGGYYIADIYEMTFNAGVQTVIEGTESDYDFYEDVDTYELYKEAVRKYYKYGITPNATIVGSPTIINGVASGFSTANYFIMPKSFNFSNSFEMVWKINTGADISGAITGNYGGTYQNVFQIAISSSHFVLHASSDGTNTKFINNVTGTYTIQANTVYWIKSGWTGSVYYLDYSLDGVNYTRDITINNTTKIYQSPNPFLIGFNNYSSSSTDYFHGSIDFKNSYIITDNDVWWHGTLAEESSSSDYDYYKDIDIYKAFNV